MSRRCEHYTVGWICAIEIENLVACELLDEEYPLHKAPKIDHKRDPNIYTFGRIQEHNIVVACLPKGRYGTGSAALVAERMRSSFPALRFGLMVGIAGGAPSSENDIRLGDVVVSSPTPRHGGVIQYDFGKAIQDKEFEATGYLAPPPEVLLNALSHLSMQHKRKGHRILETICDMIERNPRLEEFGPSIYRSDKLYASHYTHSEDMACHCQRLAQDASNSAVLSWKLLYRQDRPTDGHPSIHYGLIASANQLMKNAIVRDALSARHNVLCFEMEAAGLMNSFPCVVIRGICDYSDSHKNDLWQPYAAAVAAAYAKELLEIIPAATSTNETNVHQSKSDTTFLYQSSANDWKSISPITINRNVSESSLYEPQDTSAYGSPRSTIPQSSLRVNADSQFDEALEATDQLGDLLASSEFANWPKPPRPRNRKAHRPVDRSFTDEDSYMASILNDMTIRAQQEENDSRASSETATTTLERPSSSDRIAVPQMQSSKNAHVGSFHHMYLTKRMLDRWARDCIKNGVIPSNDALRDKARYFARSVNSTASVPQNNYSSSPEEPKRKQRLVDSDGSRRPLSVHSSEPPSRNYSPIGSWTEASTETFQYDDHGRVTKRTFSRTSSRSSLLSEDDNHNLARPFRRSSDFQAEYEDDILHDEPHRSFDNDLMELETIIADHAQIDPELGLKHREVVKRLRRRVAMILAENRRKNTSFRHVKEKK